MLNSNFLMFIIVGIIFILVMICLILALINSSKISAYLDYTDEGDLMSAIKDYYDKVDELSDRINNSSDAVIDTRLNNLENSMEQCLKKCAVVNFNAFDDVTGNMSFALTILDNYNDGIILTSLYGHSSCNTYVRKIKNGKSRIKLLTEETESLTRAINNEKRDEEDVG